MNQFFHAKRINIKLLLSFIILTFISLGYAYTFADFLDIGVTEGYGLTGILQADTLNYLNIYLNSNILVYWDANVKNVLLPSTLWALLNGNWLYATFFNILLLFATVNYLIKIAKELHFKINAKLIIFLVLLPETFVYLIGVNKEILSLYAFTAAAYYLMKKNWLVFFLFLIFITFIRYQFIFGFVFFLFGNAFFKQYNIRFMALSFIMLASIYPLLISNIPALGQTDAVLYRSLQPGTGIGVFVESVQWNYYGLSFFATIFRFFQMVTEPWPNTNIFGDNGVNVVYLAYSISAILLLPVWLKYFRYVFFAVRYPMTITHNENVILCLSFTFFMMVALNSFVHHRYLYPGIGLIILIAFKPLVSRINRSTEFCAPVECPSLKINQRNS